MTFLIVLLLFLAYGVFYLFAPAKHLAFNSWLNRLGRRKWHEQRAYTTPYLRMQRRWSQRTPANLWKIRVTGSGSLVCPYGSSGSIGESIAEPPIKGKMSVMAVLQPQP